MSKAQRVFDPNSVGQPYPMELFAEKHSLSIRAAEIILYSNGPSRTACDAAAKSFNEAVELRHKQWQRDQSLTDGGTHRDFIKLRGICR